MPETKAQKDARLEKERIASLDGGDQGATPGNQSQDTPPFGVKKEDDGKIEVDKETLLALIESNKELKKTVDLLSANAVSTGGMGPNGPMVLRKNRDSIMRLLKYNDKYFLGYENVGKPAKPLYIYSEYNPQTRENIQFVNVILEGEDKPLKMEYVNFLREAERVEVKKISQVEHEDIKEQGMVYKKDFAENGYGMFETMVQVPVEIITKTYTYTVKLPAEDGGRELVIDGKWVNN